MKHSNVVEHVSGVVLAMQAASLGNAGPEFARLFAIAVEKFRKALLAGAPLSSSRFSCL